MTESSDDPPPISYRLKSWLHRSPRVTTPDDRGRDILPVAHDSSSIAGTGNVPGGNRDVTQNGKETAATDGPQTTSSLSTDLPTDTPVNGEKDASLGSRAIKSVPIRLYNITKQVVLSSWINWLLVFVPAGIALGAIYRSKGEDSPISPTVVFSINAVAIIPLASLLSFATESVASKLGDKIGALLNVTFGNAVELIIFIALVAKEVRIVQASLLGSILANLLLILGMCFLYGGLRFREQLYNPMITQMSASLLSLSVMSLLLPTAFHASFSNSDTADRAVVQVSRGTSVILLLVYIIYLLFQLKSHAYIYESTPQHKIDEESHPGILADMLNSSSSSSESTSLSESDSDGTSGSHKTAKRIKKALKKRKHRKFSSSSRDHQRSELSLASFPRTASSSSHPNSTPHTLEIAGHASNSITSMEALPTQYEADVDEAGGSQSGRQGVTYRDFGCEEARPTVLVGRSLEHKSKKRHGKKMKQEKLEARDPEKMDFSVDSPEPSSSTVSATQAKGHVGFDGAALNGTRENTMKRPFNFRALSSNTGLPRVFSGAGLFQPSQGTAGPSDENEPPNGSAAQQRPRLRRTISMPDRLNNAPTQPPVASVQPLPHLMPIITSRRHAHTGSEENNDGKPHLSQPASVILLLITTGLVAACAEFLVDSIDYMVDNTGVSQAFIGLIILPIVSNAAEHVTAVTVAGKNKMDLAIGVALGSSIQIALFVTPVIVLLGWCLRVDMSLYFSLFETVSLFASAFIVNYLVLDGRTNYLEGALLISAYIIISVAAFFYPSCENLSSASGPSGPGEC